MENKKIVTQKEIDDLKIDERISISDEIRNKIILIRNEMNIVERDIEKYPDRKKIKIKRFLGRVIRKFINIRK
jgi:hypothetical protein